MGFLYKFYKWNKYGIEKKVFIVIVKYIKKNGIPKYDKRFKYFTRYIDKFKIKKRKNFSTKCYIQTLLFKLQIV